MPPTYVQKVFDFFNLPRLPVSLDRTMNYPAGAEGMQMLESYGNESNITNYMVDASSDWLVHDAVSLGAGFAT